MGVSLNVGVKLICMLNIFFFWHTSVSAKNNNSSIRAFKCFSITSPHKMLKDRDTNQPVTKLQPKKEYLTALHGYHLMIVTVTLIMASGQVAIIIIYYMLLLIH